MKRVVITGLGTVNPLGYDVDVFFDNLIKGRSGIKKANPLFCADLDINFAGELPEDFDPSDTIEKKKLRNYETFTTLSVYAAKKAFYDSGLENFEYEPNRFGTLMSTGGGGIKAYMVQDRKAIKHNSYKVLKPTTLVLGLSNMSTGQVAIELNAKGPNMSINTACASGTNSIGEAMHIIKRGDADLILAGAGDASDSPLCRGSFKAMRALSNARDINRASIPFDKQRSGFVISSGAGALILEDLDHAIKRKAKIYAEIVGYGSTCDANHITAPAVDGPVRAMQKAIESANLKPEDISYVNAHATSTLIGDINEVRAIKRVFKDHSKNLKVSSIKASIGHSLGASGAIEAIMMSKALVSGMVPGTINSNGDDPECDLDFMINGSENLKPKYIMSNSLGFGGHNATIIFKKWEGE